MTSTTSERTVLFGFKSSKDGGDDLFVVSFGGVGGVFGTNFGLASRPGDFSADFAVAQSHFHSRSSFRAFRIATTFASPGQSSSCRTQKSDISSSACFIRRTLHRMQYRPTIALNASVKIALGRSCSGPRPFPPGRSPFRRLTSSWSFARPRNAFRRNLIILNLQKILNFT